MSDRGSFTTEFIYCDNCLAAAKEHLIQNYKYLKGVQIPGWQDGDGLLPIIAGKIGGIGGGDIYTAILSEAGEMLSKVCHPVRVSLIPEEGNPVYIIIDPVSKEVVQSWENEQ